MPKAKKDFVLDSLANILDIQYKPKTSNSILKGGLDFIINLNTNENIINERLKDCKYDPLTGKIYNESEINNSGKINIDKKIYERLINEIPDFSNNKFNLMKNEYDDNISKIERFYNNFGFYTNKKGEGSFNKIKEIIHLYQQIEIEDKEEINNYINEHLLKILYKENDKKEKQIFINLKREDDDEKDYFHVEPSINKVKSQSTLIHKKEISLISEASEYVYNKIMNFTFKYKDVLKKFTIFYDQQYIDLCKKYDKIQRRFDKFLGLATEKKKLVDVYVHKYNNFMRKFQRIANHQYVYDEFKNDIEDLNNKLWLFVRQKQSECIIELNTIFSEKYFEKEIKKYYMNMLELFKIETEKFLTSLDIIFKVYGKKNEEEEEKPFNYDLIFEKTKIPSIFDDKDYYIKNINTIYLNCIRLVLNQEEKVKNLENYMKSLTQGLNDSTTTKHHHKRNLNASSLNATHFKLNEPIPTYEEDVMYNIKKEKLKYKFRLTVIKYFSLDYIERLFYTTQRVHHNMDSWIMMCVRLQNIALSNIKQILIKYIDKGKEIPEYAFNNVEMDFFDREYEVYEQINYEHILGSRKRESHVHLDFHYDLNCLQMAYHEMGKYSVENNVMSKYIFKEMFIKEILFNRSEPSQKPVNAGISFPLRYLSYKDIMRLVDKFRVEFQHNQNLINNNNNQDNQHFNNFFNNNKINENNKNLNYYDNFNNNNNNNGKEVYEDYVDYGGIFTIIAIIGSSVLSSKNKAAIENDFKDKLIKGSYVKKEDFMNYHFWFEDDEYLQPKNNMIGIKDLLFDIWKDEKGENMNLKDFVYSISNAKHGGKEKDHILKINYYNYALY